LDKEKLYCSNKDGNCEKMSSGLNKVYISIPVANVTITGYSLYARFVIEIQINEYILEDVHQFLCNIV